MAAGSRPYSSEASGRAEASSPGAPAEAPLSALTTGSGHWSVPEPLTPPEESKVLVVEDPTKCSMSHPHTPPKRGVGPSQTSGTESRGGVGLLGKTQGCRKKGEWVEAREADDEVSPVCLL